MNWSVQEYRGVLISGVLFIRVPTKVSGVKESSFSGSTLYPYNTIMDL